MKIKILSVLGVSLAVSAMVLSWSAAWASDDFQSWSTLSLKTWKNDSWDLSTDAQIRLVDDASDDGYYEVNEKLRYRGFGNVDLGTNYTYISQLIKDTRHHTEEFKYQHRFELEVDPHWKLENGIEIKNLNRIEFRWIEGKGSDNPQLRHRWEFVFPLKGLAPLYSFYVSNEFIYDLHGNQYNENRAIPLGLGFKLNDKTNLRVFYMIQAKKGSNDWSSAQVIGTYLSVSF